MQHCLAWQRDGLQIPDAVRVATDEYRKDMDVLGEFIGTSCIEGADEVNGASRLYSAYKTWADDGGEYVMSQTMFGRQLADRGFKKERCSKTGRNTWRGLRVRNSDDDAPTASDAATAAAYREPGPGMGVSDDSVARLFDEIASAEQSEQFERENGISDHEAVISERTRIEHQTIQTVQGDRAHTTLPALLGRCRGASPAVYTAQVSTSLASVSMGNERSFDMNTEEGQAAYSEYLISMV